jgi:hypothetical protein
MPDFYALPGAAAVAGTSGTPPPAITHALNAVLGGRCFYLLGSYDDARVRFTPAANTRRTMGHATQMFDYDPHYSACRTFIDFATGRHILTADVYEERAVDSHGGPWGWATVQAIPRALVLYNSTVGPRLRTEPIAELATLRLPAVAAAGHQPVTLQPNSSSPALSGVRGASLELAVDLTLPLTLPAARPWRCGVRVLVDRSATSPEWVEVGLSSNDHVYPGGFSRWMNATDFGGGDLAGGGCNPNVVVPNMTAASCQAACDADAQCDAWTFVSTSGNPHPTHSPRCCLKGCCPHPGPNPACTSGVKDPARYRRHQQSPTGGPLQVYTDTTSTARPGVTTSVHSGDVFLDKRHGPTVELRVFVDRSITTAFVAGGVAAVTTRSYQTGLGVSAAAAVGLGAELFNAGEMECTFGDWESWELEEIFPPRNGGFRYPLD